jgi:mRNA-degrading endonuclease toxin of MazEF toxin-antitoxin module
VRRYRIASYLRAAGTKVTASDDTESSVRAAHSVGEADLFVLQAAHIVRGIALARVEARTAVTRTVRGIPTEVAVGAEEGLPAEGVAALDNILTFPKAMLVRRLGALAAGRRREPCEALRAVTDC